MPQASNNLDDVTEALRRIRRMIGARASEPDGKLPTERKLSEDLGIGRRAVRQALEALEEEGLIWRRRGAGTFIGQPPDPTGAIASRIVDDVDPLLAMEARLCIEPALAALAARRATGEDVLRLRRLCERAAEPDSLEAVELWDGSLHRLIAKIAGNPIMMTAFGILDEVRSSAAWSERKRLDQSAEAAALNEQQHRAIVDAIEARDKDGAWTAMATHLTSLSENLRQPRRKAEDA